jgi:hypothetical protein
MIAYGLHSKRQAAAREPILTLAKTWLQLAAIFDEDNKLLKRCGETRTNVIQFKPRRHRPIRLKPPRGPLNVQWLIL